MPDAVGLERRFQDRPGGIDAIVAACVACYDEAGAKLAWSRTMACFDKNLRG